MHASRAQAKPHRGQSQLAHDYSRAGRIARDPARDKPPHGPGRHLAALAPEEVVERAAVEHGRVCGHEAVQAREDEREDEVDDRHWPPSARE